MGPTSSLIYKHGLIEFNQDSAVGHGRLSMAHPRVGLIFYPQARLRLDRVLLVCAKTTLHGRDRHVCTSSSWEGGFRKGRNDFQGFAEKFLTLEFGLPALVLKCSWRSHFIYAVRRKTYDDQSSKKQSFFF